MEITSVNSHFLLKRARYYMLVRGKKGESVD